MRKNKMLFIFKRYKHNNNKVSASENFSFLSIISFIVIIFLKFIAKNSNEESFDMNSSKDIKKRSTSTFKTFKKKMIQKFDLLNIIEINILVYYYLTRNKENRFFFDNK